MSSRDVIRELKRNGWMHIGTEGDHFQFRHPTRPGKVTVPHPKKDLGIREIISIEKQSGLALRRKG
jgi:predicted RNA binding protein YcfA (HicA-like mRNA interferase family)